MLVFVYKHIEIQMQQSKYYETDRFGSITIICYQGKKRHPSSPPTPPPPPPKIVFY